MVKMAKIGSRFNSKLVPAKTRYYGDGGILDATTSGLSGGVSGGGLGMSNPNIDLSSILGSSGINPISLAMMLSSLGDQGASAIENSTKDKYGVSNSNLTSIATGFYRSPLRNIKDGFSNISEGKVGRGILDMIPFFGGAYEGWRDRKDAISKREDTIKNEELADKQELDALISTDKQYLQDFNPYTTSTQMFKYGGNMKAKLNSKISGNLTPIGSTGAKVQGGSHESGRDVAIDANNDGMAEARVEGGEYIEGDMVFSARLGFAEPAKELGLKKAKAEKQLEDTDIHKRNSAKRLLETIQIEFTNLFNQQKQKQVAEGVASNGVPKMANGGIIPPGIPEDIWTYITDYYKNNDVSTMQAGSDQQSAMNLTNRQYGNFINNGSKLGTKQYNPMLRNLPDNPAESITTLSPKSAESMDFSQLPSNEWVENYRPEDNEALTKFLDDKARVKSPNTASTGVPDSKLKGAQSPTSTVKGMASGNVEELATNLVPLIDNIVNYNLTQKTPQIPKPTYLKATPSKVGYNIEPQLSEINKSERSFGETVDNSTSNSAVSRANKLTASAASLGLKNQAYGQKENYETQLTNQARQYSDNVARLNANLKDNYNMNVTKREAGILADYSANVADLQQDIKWVIDRKDMTEYQRKQLLLDMAKHSDTNAFYKALKLGMYDNKIKADEAQALYDQLNAKATKDDTEKELLKLYISLGAKAKTN